MEIKLSWNTGRFGISEYIDLNKVNIDIDGSEMKLDKFIENMLFQIDGLQKRLDALTEGWPEEREDGRSSDRQI